MLAFGESHSVRERKFVAMGFLDLMLSWVNRVVILVSVLLLTLTTLSKQDNLPLSRSTLLVGHLCSFRCALLLAVLSWSSTAVSAANGDLLCSIGQSASFRICVLCVDYLAATLHLT